MVTSGNANSANTGLAFVWGCACLPGFSYKKADLRALFRHIDPATRKPEPNAFLQYMRRAVEVSVLNRPTAYLMSSLWALKQKFRWVIGRVWLRPMALRRQSCWRRPPYPLLLCHSGGMLLVQLLFRRLAKLFKVSYLQALFPR